MHAQDEPIKITRPLSIRVYTMPLASMCRAMPFALFDVDIVVKKIEMWFIEVCILINNEDASLLFS